LVLFLDIMGCTSSEHQISGCGACPGEVEEIRKDLSNLARVGSPPLFGPGSDVKSIGWVATDLRARQRKEANRKSSPFV